MAEIEKKYSDYQTSECDTQETIDPIDEKLCPTCQINPDWKLPAAHWSMIQEAYLNESVCEYHVRVYEKEKAINTKRLLPNFNLESEIKKLAVDRILVDLDKPLNNGTTQQLLNTCFIVDTFRSMESQELGMVYLVGVPAFNLDQIKSNESGESEISSIEEGTGGEIIIDFSTFNRKLRQLRLALKTYGTYYALANKSGAGFVIRQRDDETKRISYKDTTSKIKQFRSELNDRLVIKGYPKMGKTGVFKKKRAKKIKFVFRDNGKPYDLKKVFVLDADCDKYKKIPIPNGHLLRKPSMRVVYGFLDKFDQVINDITAKETKPWLDFTLENFYPDYIVDYGNLAKIEETKAGLECLLELELGIGNGKVIDSLTAEILSAFDTIEKELAEQACRSLQDLSTKGATALAEEKKDLGKSPKEEREIAMKKRYEKEFENKALQIMVEYVDDYINSIFEGSTSGFEPVVVNRGNVFERMREYGIPSVPVSVPYFANKKTRYYPAGIKNKESILNYKKDYSTIVFNAMEAGTTGDQIQNSPHFQEAMDAAEEVITKFENTYMQPVKDALSGRSEFELVDLIPTIGLCGMSKIAGKAMECIANGVSFDAFLDILIEKTFDFMEVNTFGLFLNGLPYQFRAELNKTIEEQFGGGVDISTLLGIKQAEDGSQKMKDFVKSKQVARRVMDIYKSKWKDGDVSMFKASLTEEEEEFISGVIGPFTGGGSSTSTSTTTNIVYDRDGNPIVSDTSTATMTVSTGGGSWNKVYDAFVSMGWDNQTNVFLRSEDEDDNVYRRKPGSESEELKKMKPKKYVLSLVKYLAREHKKSQSSFRQAINRVASSVGSLAGDVIDSVEDITSERRELISAIDNLDAMIEAEREVINVIIADKDLFNPDGTIQYLTLQEKRVVQLSQMKELYKRIKDYKSVKQELTDELEGFVGRRTREEASEAENRLEFLIDRGLQDTTQNIAETLREFQSFYQSATTNIGQAINDSIITSEEIRNTPEGELNAFEQAAKSFEETALGVKVDAVFDVIFDFALDSIMDYFSLDELFKMLRSYPAVDFALDKIEELFIKPCPVAPVIYPPANDFMKSLKVDVCDPTVSMTFPKLIVPNINFRFELEYQFNEIFREAIIKVVSDIAISLLKRLMSTLESALCNLVETAGGIVAEGLRGNLKGSFYRALNEAFCNDGEDPNTSQSKAEQLAEALFAPLSFDSSGDYTGSGASVANIISSVASTEEFLESMVARDGEENDQFNQRIANAVTALAPEMEVLLGDPNQVAYFFKSLGSFLSPEDRARIRDMLAAGVPNLPISAAICLTNDQLNEWNKLREELLRDLGIDPDGTVKKLNEETLAALEGTMDDVAELDTDGPFIGAATNEALKDVCNPNNLFNDVSQSPTDKALEDELVAGFFSNISRFLTIGFMMRGGLLGEAMRDTENRREFGRSFQKLFRLNYADSQDERDAKYGDAWRITQWIMDRGDDDNEDGVADAQGVYPETVAIKQRKEILEGGMIYDFDRVKSGKASSRNVVYRYIDQDDTFSYKQKIAASNLRQPKKTFGYNLQVTENIDDEGPSVEVNLNTPVPISQVENSFMESKGFQYKANEKQDIRKAAFQNILLSQIPIAKNFSSLYEQMFETSNKKIVEALLTNYSTTPPSLPNGYKFGYESDNLTKASFEYTPSEEEGKLGKFAGHPRVRALDPKIYGGRYSSPPYYVEPRKFTGWLELATTAFESQDGCDPKTPPLLSFQDIEDRVKNLGSSLRNDPRLSKSRDCVSVKPFHLLLDNKSKAKLDGVVRTTLRTYIAEFFMKGYGLFSNLQIRSENFDASFSSYIARKMQSEMQELGTSFSNRKVRIVRERYWYTFLEQSVEAYQRMIDVDGIEAPPAVLDALNKIQLGLDKYRVVDKEMKKKLRKEIKDLILRRPSANYNPLEEINKGPRYNLAMAVAFRLADEDEKESFFNGEVEEKVKTRTIRYAKLKKLQFFQKIYFIKLFEKEALLIMSEFIRSELDRMSKLVIDGPTDKPYYFDLYKSFFGMKSFFPESTSQVGLNSYYLGKQEGTPDPGLIPTIKSSNLSPPLQPADEPQYVIESYVRLVEREAADIPSFIRTRPTKMIGAVSLTDMSGFVSENLDRLEGKNLSDFFGDLSFVYSARIFDLFDKGFALKGAVERLVELNPDKEDIINKAFMDYVMPTVQVLGGQQPTVQPLEEQVVYDESFILEGEKPTPTGTIGSTGVKYGLRVSIVLPQGAMTSQDIQKLKTNSSFVNKSKQEKAFLFEDGTVMLPLISTEMDVIDAAFEDFDPFSGTERYDLECLINKAVEDPSFTVMFDKILNFRQASSMLSIYCMETLPASIGRDESERSDISPNPDVDDWDRSVNKVGKNFLRREFRSLYLSNTEDGLSDDDDDDNSSLPNLIAINNPFDGFALPAVKLPWWLRRRMKTKIYDANGQSCADPEKDLE